MHRAGLPVFEQEGLGDEDLFDLDARARFLGCRRRCPSSSRWNRLVPSGRCSTLPHHKRTMRCHEACTRRSWFVASTRRHRRIGLYFRDEIAEPLGIDFWIGLPDEQAPRVSGTPARPDGHHPAPGRRRRGDSQASDDPRHRLYDYEIAFLRRLLTQPDSIPSRALNCLAPSGVAPSGAGESPEAARGRAGAVERVRERGRARSARGARGRAAAR